jgi:shikimate kinase
MILQNSNSKKITEGRFIVLVGLMGAGKTTLGRRIAPEFGLPFIDSDSEVEKAAGCTIGEIFKNSGEKIFRDVERRVMLRLLSQSPAVIGSGGGSFMDVDTRNLIREKGTSIWLRADLELLYRRARRRTHRPLLNNDDPRNTLMGLMKERHAVYQKADLIFDVTEEPPDKMAIKLVETLINYGIKNKKVAPAE